MINQIVAGVGLGLLMAIMLGPVFFMLINISIKNGFRSAFYFALGVVLSDGFYISIIEFSKSLVGFLDSHRDWVAIVGGILLIGFGISSIVTKVSDPKDIAIKNDVSSKDLFFDIIIIVFDSLRYVGLIKLFHLWWLENFFKQEVFIYH